MSFFEQLRERNTTRQGEWEGSDKVDMCFRGLEFGGEAGELQGAVKKLFRAVNSIKGNGRTTSSYVEQVQEEIGDVLITLDLLVEAVEKEVGLRIDMEQCARDKFNYTSDKVGMKTKWVKTEWEDNDE